MDHSVAGARPDEWVRRFARTEVNGRSVYREQGGDGILVTRGEDGRWAELSQPPSEPAVTLPVDSVRIRRDKPEPQSIAQRILERCRNLQGRSMPAERELFEVFPRDTWITQGHSSRRSEAPRIGRLDSITLFADTDSLCMVGRYAPHPSAG